jgi:hypothetical protein
MVPRIGEVEICEGMVSRYIPRYDIYVLFYFSRKYCPEHESEVAPEDDAPHVRNNPDFDYLNTLQTAIDFNIDIPIPGP